MKDFIFSTLFAIVITFLPFWQWGDGITHIVCGFAIFVIIYGFVRFADEMEEKYGRK